MKKDNKKEVNNKYLIMSILYFVCSLLWIVGIFNKIVVNENYLFDAIISVLLIVISIYYYVKHRKLKNKFAIK